MKKRIIPVDELPESKLKISNENEYEAPKDPNKFYAPDEYTLKDTPSTSSEKEKESEDTVSEKVSKPILENLNWGWGIAAVFILVVLLTAPKAIRTISQLGKGETNVVQNQKDTNVPVQNKRDEGTNIPMIDETQGNDESNNTTSSQTKEVPNIVNKRQDASESDSLANQLNQKITNNMITLRDSINSPTQSTIVHARISKNVFNGNLNSLNREYDQLIEEGAMTQKEADILGDKLNLCSKLGEDLANDPNADIQSLISEINESIDKLNELEDDYQNIH